jgi:copper(I)-binding protein
MRIIRSLAASAALAALLHAAPASAQEADPATALMMDQEPVVAGTVTISLAWARATPPGAPTAAGYLSIANTGDTDETLVSVAAAIAGMTEIHQMIMADDRMMMRPLEDGLVIAAGETIVLEPGGHHLMFMNIGDALVEGTIVDVTLTFANAGAVDVTLVVYPIGSDGPEAGEVGAFGFMHRE